MSCVTLNLMLDNMAGKQFDIIQKEISFLFVPLIAYHIFGVDAATEKGISLACTMLALTLFAVRTTIIALQWRDLSGKPLLYIPKEAEKTISKAALEEKVKKLSWT